MTQSVCQVYTLEQSDSASLGAALRAAHAYRCACEGRGLVLKMKGACWIKIKKDDPKI